MEEIKKVLSGIDFDKFRQCIESRTGIYIDDSKQSSFKIILDSRMDILGIKDYNAYYSLATTNPMGGKEFDELLNLILIKETFFFRDERQLRVLTGNILPELIERKKGKEIKIWSAGCATGEEPYSIAMAILENFPPGSINVSIYATDIDSETVRKAKEGVYNKNSMRTIDKPILNKYFVQKEGRYYLDDQVKQRVHFDRINLLEPYFSDERDRFDIIFCKNVIIYFRLETVRKIIHWFYEMLTAGGCLFVGHSESLWQISDEFELEEISGVFLYRKSGSNKTTSVPKGFQQGERGTNCALFLRQGLLVTSGEKVGQNVSSAAQTAGVEVSSLRVERKEKKLAKKQTQRASRTPIASPALLSSPFTKGGLTEINRRERMEIYEEKIKNLPKKGLLLPEEDDYEAILEGIQKVLENDPKNVDAHLLVGKAYASIGLYDKALKKGMDILEIEDLYADAYILIGSVYYKIGEREKAIASFKKAVYLDNKSVVSHYYLGNLYKGANLVEQAIKEYKNVIHIFDINHESSEWLAGEVFTVKQLKEICAKNIEILTGKER